MFPMQQYFMLCIEIQLTFAFSAIGSNKSFFV